MSTNSLKVSGQVVPEVSFNKRVVLKFVDYLFSYDEVADVREELVRSNLFISKESITSCRVVLSRIIIGFCSSSVLKEVLKSGLQIYKVRFPPSSISLVEEVDTKAWVPAGTRSRNCGVGAIKIRGPHRETVSDEDDSTNEDDVQGLADGRRGISLLPCPQYLPLKRLCRCEHQGRSTTNIKVANSPRQVLPNVKTPELAGLKVLWTQAMWQTEECNMISKAMHYLDWEKVWQLFGPNIYIISRTRTHMNEIWTQVLVTRRTYTSLMKLDLHTHGSALLLGQHGRILNAVSYQQATHTVTHFTQIALEDLHGDGRWFYDDSIEHSPHLPRPNRFNDGQQDEEVSQPKCAETSTDAANLHSLLQTKKLPESHDKNLLGSLTKLGIGHRGTSRSKPQPKDSKPLVNDSSVATGAIEGNIETEDSDEVSVHSDAISSASFQMSEEDESTQTDSDQESIYSDAISSDSFQMCEEDEEELDFSKRIVIKFVDNLFNDGEVGELREELVRSNQFIMEDSITSCKVVLSRIIIGFSSISVLNEVLTKGVEIFGVSFPPSSMRLVDDLDSEEMGSAVIRPDSWSVWNNPEVSPKLYLVTEMNEDVGKPDVLGLTDIDASLLPCPQYLPLERLSRCVHLEDAIEIITEEHLPSSTIASNRKKEVADIKVLWCQGMWPVRRHNMFGNVSFYLDWEEVLERFGPNIYCLNIGRTQKDEIRTQLLVTRKTYTTLQKLDLHTHGSALLLGTDGRMLRAVSYQQGSHTVTHITQIALEDLDDDGRWFYASCDKMCNDHMTKEHHFCFKYNIMRKKKPCPSPLKAGDTWMLLESWLGPEEMARVFETKL